jgi:tetratricopeptide (TPR) repeat protein
MAVVLAAASTVRAQDFDPHGRHRSKPVAPGPSGSQVSRAPASESPTPGAGSGAGPTQTALIDRYTRIVLSQPGAAFPLERLAQLYRDRDGNLAGLASALEVRATRPGADGYAATVALAGICKLDGRIEDAIATYEKALVLEPNDARALLPLARLLEDRGDLSAARGRYEQALSLQTARVDKEQTLRTLMGLALTAKDWTAASAFHAQLVHLEPTSLFVRGELGRALFARGEYARAEAELKPVVADAAGDNRALAPALEELGRAQAKAHEFDAALATLERALVAAGAETALRTEIYETIAEIYRADQRLPVLVGKLESDHPGDAVRLALLGSLYEEIGESAKAIGAYRRALAVDPRQIDLHVRLIHLLQSNGDLDRAIAEYETLIRAAPGNPQFVFEECDALLQRGDRTRALALITDLEARAANDDEVLSRVADFLARIGETERSLRVLQHLAAASGATDPGHLVDLGDRYFQDGDAKLAVQTWLRILAVVQPRAKALSALGDVYLEHDMSGEAVAAYREAVQLDPASLAYKKGLASALERTHAFRDARALYEEIVTHATETGDKALARECRSRIVALWGLERVLDQQIPPLAKQFAATPPDLEAGRMLAEALLHLRKLPEAEAALRRLIELAPGDGEAHLALERVLVQENKIGDAIAVLEQLAVLDPKRAREIYQRMAEYAVKIYHDDDAIKYAERVVELNPDDAEGHRHLAEMYRSKTDIDRAIAEFRAAITRNDRLFVVYFELADLLLSKGKVDEADRLFRSVIRGAPDEELVARAARLSMQINLGRGSLESLEQDLLPLAIGNAQRPLYRRLLVEIYGSMTYALVQRVRHGTASDAAHAREALARIGARAVKPLLDALADGDVSQQRIAIDVLAYVQNRNAALPLFVFATGPADLALRTRAMEACARLMDPALVPRYESLLIPKGEGADQAALADAVGVAAVWGLAKMSDQPAALPVLRRVALISSPAMRALAVLGLGMAHDATSVAEVADIARSADVGAVAQAAAAYALGDLNAHSEVPILLEISEDGEGIVRRMSLLALARMAVTSAKPPAWLNQAVPSMCDAIFARDSDEPSARKSAEAIARAAVSALTAIATHGESAHGWAKAKDTMPEPEGALDAEALLDSLVPRGDVDADRATALVQYAGPIERAARAAVQTSGPRSSAVMDALGTGEGEFLPFVTDGVAGPATDAARAITAALEPSLVPLARHPDPAIRAKALVLIARLSSDEATDAVIAGLEDATDTVRRIALAAVCAPRADGTRAPANERAVGVVARILATDESWAMRILAAQALGRMASGGASGATARLAYAATSDPFALVRQSALDSLASSDPAAARAVAHRVATSDPEPRVRESARALER